MGWQMIGISERKVICKSIYYHLSANKQMNTCCESVFTFGGSTELLIFTNRIRSMGDGKFSQVFVCSQGVCLGREGVCLGRESTCRGSARRGLHGGVCMEGGLHGDPHRRDTVNRQSVRILLECILVAYKIASS